MEHGKPVTTDGVFRLTPPEGEAEAKPPAADPVPVVENRPPKRRPLWAETLMANVRLLNECMLQLVSAPDLYPLIALSREDTLRLQRYAKGEY